MTGNTKQAHSPPDDEQSGPFKLWAGSGTGKRCDYCGKVILSDDVQYDVEVTGSSGGGKDIALRHAFVSPRLLRPVARRSIQVDRGSHGTL